ncbi:unnamed protein product [Arctia plantaginis]|uniref:Uncharacterized protein n=1 Tax=Arctia plantaginis TaxID=874455 RepID=A0A8S0ZEE4_ARCPL|nr:unnamed protein product [Arctia plantaginis]CAB3252402.1 unnamed protein product [Arctia plantaginis]
MSRYYNEEWQRRKTYLIRSLFHDIPYRVLSPVLEESNQSSQTQISAESSRSRSSDANHTVESYPTSYEYQLTSESESSTPSESRRSDQRIADTGKTTPDPRPYSPLPPLIIEVEPNRHDEQEEFYAKLLLKMRKIYRRMFFEGKFISDEEFFESDIERAGLDNSCLNEEPSFNVNLESTREDNILKEITNVDKRCAVEDKSNENLSVDSSCDEDSDNDMEDIEQESCASNEDEINVDINETKAKCPHSHTHVHSERMETEDCESSESESSSSSESCCDSSSEDENDNPRIPNKKYLRENLKILRSTLAQTASATEMKDLHLEPQTELELNQLAMVNIVDWIEQRLNGKDPSTTPLKDLLDRIRETMLVFQEAKEEPAYSQMTFKADIHIDGTPLPQVRPSPIYEEPRIEVLSASVKKFSYEVTQSLPADSLPSITSSNSKISTSETTPILLYKQSPNRTQSFQGEEQPFELNSIPVHETSHEELMPSQMDKSKLEIITDTLVFGQQLEVARDVGKEESVSSPILTSTRRFMKPRKCSKTVFEDNQEHICTQPATEAKVDIEDSHCDVANRRKEDAAFVLRFRKTIEEHSLSVERNLTILENNEGSDKTPSSDESDAIMKEIEIMRTPRPDESKESTPTGANRFSSNVHDSSDQNIMASNVSDVTPVIEDDEHMSAVQQKHSEDIDDVLALLFNTTPELRESATAKDTLSSQMSSSRKRRFEERFRFVSGYFIFKIKIMGLVYPP